MDHATSEHHLASMHFDSDRKKAMETPLKDYSPLVQSITSKFVPLVVLIIVRRLNKFEICKC